MISIVVLSDILPAVLFSSGFKQEIKPTREWESLEKAANCIKSSAVYSSKYGS